MKFIIAAALAVTATLAAAQTYVPGYTKKNGAYVEGHMRSAPNSTRYDNYGSQNNVYGGTNPYTGQRGSQRDEFSSTPQFNQPRNTQRQCFTDPYGNTRCQ